ncbi:MAG: M20/M25/M40 family metallo-hydrolase [Eubacterium sp.]|nr:M20/M25/M40 family metallo-hydrolase [Eubacterium sp.]
MLSRQIKIKKQRALENFSRMIQCSTVDGCEDEFIRFRNTLSELYPNIEKICEREFFGKGIVYRWKGMNSNKSIILMSHYDVVPAKSGEWTYEPFSGTIANGRVWGRGALDTKCTLAAIMESVESLIQLQFIPKTDIYLCFGGDEETTGESARQIAKALNSRGVRPFLILDEGGAIVDANPYGISKPCALVGIAEKGYMDVEFIIRGKGGHTSLPSVFCPLSEMGELIRRISKNPFGFKLCKPVSVMIKHALKYMNFKHRALIRAYSFWGRWFFKRLVAEKFPEIKALSGTIGAITQINGGTAANVIPEQVRATGNFRLISGESVEYTLNRIKKSLKGLSVEINLIEGLDPSKASPTEGEGWDALKNAITSSWGESAIVPYLMLAGSDSRYYSLLSDSIYRFSPCAFTRTDLESIHGVNESIDIDSFFRTIYFYINLIVG